MFCSKCEAELIVKNNRLVCPHDSFPHFLSDHYRGEKGCLDAVSSGAGIRYGWIDKKTIEVPDAPEGEGWNSINDGPKEAGTYEVLDTRTGAISILFRSIESGGWWDGTVQFTGPRTHWRKTDQPPQFANNME